MKAKNVAVLVAAMMTLVVFGLSGNASARDFSGFTDGGPALDVPPTYKKCAGSIEYTSEIYILCIYLFYHCLIGVEVLEGAPVDTPRVNLAC